MDTVIFQCEDSLEGILTGVYEAWEEALSSKLGHDHCRLAVGEAEPELFCRYVDVKASEEKAGKVIRTVLRRLGKEVFTGLCYAAASSASDKAEVVYKTMVCGFSMKDGRKVLSHLSNPYAAQCFALWRNTEREAHAECEFLRFRELENGVLFAKIHPKNNVLMFLGEHFSDRLPLENFIIYDTARRIALFHEKEKKWYLMRDLDVDKTAEGRLSAEEEFCQESYRLFCDAISIKSRENKNLGL